MNKRPKFEIELCYIINLVGIDQYLNDIDRGILKFVNKDLYEKFKGYEISINNVYYIYKYSTWYCDYFNFNPDKIHNINWVLLNDYHNIFNANLSRNRFITDIYIEYIIMNDAVKCFEIMMKHGYRVLLVDLINSCIRNKPKVFQLCMEHSPLWTFSESYLFHLCEKHGSDNILKLLKDKYELIKND